MEKRNATIEGVRIGFEGHGILTAWLDLDYGDALHQSFGGYGLDNVGCAKFIRKTLETVGVDDWNDLVGKTIRVECEHTGIAKIGHITKNKWFEPSKDLK